MKEKIDIIKFKHRITFYSFIFFLLILALSPISGDDWKSFVIGRGGFLNSINNINIMDGRIISGFLINFFSYNKILFDFSCAILLSCFVKMCNNLLGSNVKTKYFYLYPLIGLLLVSVFTFSYNYLSISSTVAYTFPTILFIMYFYNLLTSEELDNYLFIKLLLFSIFICLSSIHIGFTFLIANIVYFIIKKDKNISKYFILISVDLLLIIISLSLVDNSMLFTGIDSLKDNIPYYIENVFSNNIIIFLLGAIPINIFLYKKLKNNIYGRVVITLFNLILVFSLSYNFFNYSPVNLNLILSRYNGIFATENWYYIIYFIIYIFLFTISVNYHVSNRKVKEIFNIFIISSCLLSLLMLFSPIFDRGNTIFIILSMIFILCYLAKEMNTKVFSRIVKIVIIILSIYYISMFAVIKYIDVTRTDYIKEQINNNDSNILVKANPTYYIWRYNPIDYFQIKDFKEYYSIGSDKSIEVKYFGLFEQVEKIIKE